MSSDQFAHIDLGRLLEVEAIEGGRTSNEFSMSPLSDYSDDQFAVPSEDDEPVNLRQVDDAVDTEERANTAAPYVVYATRAYQERGLTYPFFASKSGDRLEIKPGMESLARKCASLSEIISIGGKQAKSFERRSAQALQILLGGWHANVGSPWDSQSTTEKAIAAFRHELDELDCGLERHPTLDTNIRGDFGADGIGILGRSWGGPILIMQSKNAPFDTDKFAGELLKCADAVYAWFGRRVDHFRTLVIVCAVNTVLTIKDKELQFQRAGAQRGFHILDAVDILLAESSLSDSKLLRNAVLCL